jgi:hypothetical protein
VGQRKRDYRASEGKVKSGAPNNASDILLEALIVEGFIL